MFGTIGIYELLILISIYAAICFGFIASKLGKNGIVFGLLSVIPLLNIIILSILAFSKPNYGKILEKTSE